jgi:hypothetical protein
MLYDVRHLQPRARALHDHDDWNTEVRGETPMQRADRAYGEILQEVRVAQTGVQLLFAFLLALAFQARFASVTGFQRGTYVVTLMLCAAAAALLIAPAAFHRVVYGMRLKQQLVQVANRLALSGLALLLLSLVSAVFLILDVVLGMAPAIVLAAGTFAWFAMWWFVLPLRSRFRQLGAEYPSEDRLSEDRRQPDGDR